MLRSIQRPHASRALDPDHDVLQFGINLPTGGEKFVEMFPIHANEMDRAVFAVVFKQGTTAGQKTNKLFPAELTGTLGEFAVADLSFAGSMTIDANIVRGINQDNVRPVVRHQSLKGSLGRRIAAMNVMASKLPDIAELANLQARLRAGIIDILDNRLTKLLDRQIDLGQAKPRDRQIKIPVELLQLK